MSDELDNILLQQLHVMKKQKKIIKRVRKLYGHDPMLDIGEVNVDNKILFLQSMIQDKSILKNKKPKIDKRPYNDILSRNPIWELYRHTIMISLFSYKTITDTVSNYFSSKSKQ